MLARYPAPMRRLLLCIFCAGTALFVAFCVAIGFAIAGYEVPHRLLVWMLVLGIIGSVGGSPVLAKRKSQRGFDVITSDEQRAG
jgi:hypothetical protein